MALQPGASDTPAAAIRRAILAAGAGVLAFALLAAALAFGWAVHATDATLAAAVASRKAVLEAVFAGGAELEAPAGRDEPAADEKARAILAALDDDRLRARLLLAHEPDDPDAVRVPIAGTGARLSVRLVPEARLAAGLAAALPFLLAGLIALAGLASVDRLARPRLADTAERLARYERRLREETVRREATEAAEARLSAALETVAQPVALVDREGRVLFANGAFRARAGEEAGIGAVAREVAAHAGMRAIALASGERILIGASEPDRAPAPAAGVVVPFARVEGVPRLADRLQELAEALARVAREAVLLHGLAPDAASRARAETLRAAAERCTRLVAGLIAPTRTPRRRAVALDRLVEERLAAPLVRRGRPPLLGIAPALPPVVADPEELATLFAALADGLAVSPGGLRIRLRRAGEALSLDLETAGGRPSAEAREAWREAAAAAGGSLVVVPSAEGLVLRLRFPVHAEASSPRIARESASRGTGAA
ncbi:MAG: PAS domain-containing protein [Geminicoccaceae bacterium]|nr:PAS domain-containing protein [Geminicoccaceae bacterium]